MKCANCSFYKVDETIDCLYHHIECEADDCCDNFEDKTETRYALAQHIAEAVVGTCDFHSEYREIMDTFTSEEWGAFDEITFECACCGWWCETGDEGDINGERYCSECYSDVEDDEE
jgi:hypothetical protein